LDFIQQISSLKKVIIIKIYYTFIYYKQLHNFLKIEVDHKIVKRYIMKFDFIYLMPFFTIK